MFFLVNTKKKDMDSLVSIIVPVYNVEKYIHEAVDSIINQTYKNLDIILVDDGSPDDSGKICDEYAASDVRIKVIHKENGGLSSARNAGVRVARGEWIYFMDSDDWIEINTIEKVLCFAIENSCDMCIFDYETVTGKKCIHREALKDRRSVFTDLSDESVFATYACSKGFACNYITKSCAIKELRFDEKFSVYEDQTFKWELYGQISSFCYMKEAFYHYRYVPSSLCNSRGLTFDIRIKNYNRMYKTGCNIVRNCNYPQNAVKSVHSKYLESFFMMCSLIFDDKEPLLIKVERYKKYVNSDEFRESIKDFNDLYFSKELKICLKKKKAPHWIEAYVLIKIKCIVKKLREHLVGY